MSNEDVVRAVAVAMLRGKTVDESEVTEWLAESESFIDVLQTLPPPVRLRLACQLLEGCGPNKAILRVMRQCEKGRVKMTKGEAWRAMVAAGAKS